MKNLYIFILVFISQTVLVGQTPCSNAPNYDDPHSQNGLFEMMNIPCAWTITNGDPSVAVCVLDRYLREDHDDLSGKVVEIWGNCNAASGPGEVYTHGNQSLGAVAGIRNNGICIAGSAGDCVVAGYCGAGSDISIQQAVDKGYDIISISAWYDSGISKAKLEEVTNQGVTVLLAGLCVYHDADDPNGKHSVPGVIHVGRVDSDGDFWNYTNSNCPGVLNQNFDVLCAPDGQWRNDNGNQCVQAGGGTSIGTPVVAGVVALMKTVNPCLSPADIEEILVNMSQQIPANAHPGATRGGLIDAYEAVLAAKNFNGYDQTWSSTETIMTGSVSGDLSIFGTNTVITIDENADIKFGNNSVSTLEAGTTMIVIGTFSMGDDSKIIVKRGARLIVDGGHLKAANCATEWTGIEVEGNIWEAQQTLADPQLHNKNGILYITNNSILENAHTVVSMHPDHITTWLKKYHYGGLVIAENSTFRNNRRAAEFMQYRNHNDKSSFTDCTFSGHNITAEHWNNRGVTYDNCDFSDYSGSCLRTFDAAITVVNGNTFDNGNHNDFANRAINLYHTYSNPHASQIGLLSSDNNTFIGGFHHIYLTSPGGPNETLIENNVFVGGEVGIVLETDANYVSSFNDFIGTRFGHYLTNTGDYHNNYISSNSISSNELGIYAFDNNRFQFRTNCFDFSIGKDVYIGNAFDFMPDQGNVWAANGNLFSDDYKGGIRLYNTDEFKYHLEKGTPFNPADSRLTPYGNWGAFAGNVFDSGSTLVESCGINGTVGPIDVGPFDCDLPGNEADLEAYITCLEDELVIYNEHLSEAEEDTEQWYTMLYYITELRLCLENAKDKLILFGGVTGNYPELVGYFSDEGFEYQSQILSWMIYNEDYVIAEDYLSQIESTTEAYQDYIFTQDLNIDRLQNEQYTLSALDHDNLLAICNKSHIQSGYSRSLYKILTDIDVELEISDVDYEDTDDRSVNLTFTPSFKIGPNPAKDLINIKYDIKSNCNITIYNVAGQLLRSSTLGAEGKNDEINISDFDSGILSLIIRDAESQELLHFEQVIKI